jgi:hypothetical protein
VITQSCENCWFNGLQYGAIGLAVGYCTRHKKILHESAQLTCAYHRRKDLSLTRALEVSRQHVRVFPEIYPVLLHEARRPAALSADDRALDTLRQDDVAEQAVDYGTLGSTIESLAQLNRIPGARGEIAFLSLARGYVAHCTHRGGSWTSGLHLYWWTKSRLAQPPGVTIRDLRDCSGLPVNRQVALSEWSIVMLRLCLIEDIATYARADDDPLGQAVGLLDRTAEAVNTFNLDRLLRWLARHAIPSLDGYLARARYTELANALHRERETDPE